MSLSVSRLELLRRMAESREAEARKLFAEAQRKHETQVNTERELRGYLAEYEARPLASPTPALLENQRQFLLRLRSAADTQAQHAQHAAEAVEKARLFWIEQRNALRVAEALLEQGCQVARRVEERKSQREMDEFAATRRPPQAYAQ